MKPSKAHPPGDSPREDPSVDLTVSLDLVRRAQGGDDQALNKLVERYYDRVRRIVRLRLGNNLRECVDSADILQNTFIAAVQSFQAFEMREEASLINWLSRLAQHQIIASTNAVRGFGCRRPRLSRMSPAASAPAASAASSML